jgi:hypothetical protein
MPIKRMLEGRNFDSKTAATLVEAFNGVVAELDLRTPAERERAAKIIIQLAGARTVIDAANLRDEAAGLMRKETPVAAG